jgi:hypothetical protein
MRKWKLLGFAGLIGIALVGPGLNAKALNKDTPAKSARMTLVAAPVSGFPYN